MILDHFRGGATGTAGAAGHGGDGRAVPVPDAYSPIQAWVSLLVPVLALGVDALAFYPVLAIVLPALTWFFLVPIAVGLAAAAVWVGDRIRLGFRQRRANDPARSDLMTATLLVLWSGAGIAMFLARLLLGSGQVSFDGAEVPTGSTRDVFGAVTFAVLYVLSGAIAAVAAFWLFRPARNDLAGATTALTTADEHERACRDALVRARERVHDVPGEVEEGFRGAPHRRELRRYRTAVEVWNLKDYARIEMAATVKDELGRALAEFRRSLPPKPEPPKEQS
ncbi:MAG: hypothetical protein AB7J32_19030 [Pseudonocardia sp.]